MTNNTETRTNNIDTKAALKNLDGALEAMTQFFALYSDDGESIKEADRLAWEIKNAAMDLGWGDGYKEAKAHMPQEAAQPEAYTFDPTILVRLRGSRSRKEVADALDLTKKTIQQYEEGRRRPNDENIMKIARYCGVPFDAILAAVPDTNIPKVAEQPAAPTDKRDYVSVYDALCHAEAAAEKSALCLGEFINQIFEDPLIDKENIGYHVSRLRPFVEIAFDCAAGSRKECHEVMKAARS